MEYKSYQHIEKIGSSQTENILNGEVYLFYKIDGTNAVVYLGDDKTLKFGSRKKVISINNDNANFVLHMLKDKKIYNKLLSYLLKHPSYYIYGEWLVPHVIKRYNNESWNKFYIFDIYDDINHKYISYDEYSIELANNYPTLNFVPLLIKLTNPTIDDLKEKLLETGKYLITTGLGEGIVIKNYNYKNQYGEIIWAKMLTEDFLINKKDLFHNNSIEKQKFPVEHKIVFTFLKDEHILKTWFKFKEYINISSWDNKFYFQFLSLVYESFIKDNIFIILNTFHDPTINFTILKKITNKKVKEMIDAKRLD